MSNGLKCSFGAGATLLHLFVASVFVGLASRPASAQAVNCTTNDYPGGPIVSQAWLTCGTNAQAGPGSVSVGPYAGYILGGQTGENSAYFGSSAGSQSTGNFNTATGFDAFRSSAGNGNTATGHQAGVDVSGDGNTASGNMAGQDVTGHNNTATGSLAGNVVTGNNNVAVGVAAGQVVNGNDNVGVGATAGAAVTGSNNAAFGKESGFSVTGDNNAAYGANAGKSVTGSNNVAMGSAAGLNVTGSGNTAIGAGAGQAFSVNNTTSLGAGAQAVRDNQMALGTTANTYTMAGIKSAASTAAQSGPTYLATTDANGNMAATAFSTEELVATVGQSTATNIAQDASIAILADGLVDNTNAIADLDGRVGALENNSAALSNQISEVRTEARQGIAAAIAMANPGMPSAPGKTTWATNVGYFKGAVAFGGSLMYRFDTPAPTALSLGYSYGGGDSHAARMGLQGEF
jgi:prefoldin subunit 5